MKLRVTPHDFDLGGGKAVRFAEGDVEGFLGWGHIPSIARTRSIPEQFSRAEYACDFEAFDDGVLVLHKERTFRSRTQAHAWFRFVAWCLVRMTPTDFTAFHSAAWRLT